MDLLSVLVWNPHMFPRNVDRCVLRICNCLLLVQIRDFEHSSEAQESRKQELEKLMQDQESLRNSLLQWCYTSYGEVFSYLSIYYKWIRKKKSGSIRLVIVYLGVCNFEVCIIEMAMKMIPKLFPFLSIQNHLCKISHCYMTASVCCRPHFHIFIYEILMILDYQRFHEFTIFSFLPRLLYWQCMLSAPGFTSIWLVLQQLFCF